MVGVDSTQILPTEDAAEAPPAEEPPAEPRPWFAYVLWSEALGRSYVGIALDVARRLAQHQGELSGGARATRAGRPWTLLITYGPFADRSEASKAEYAIRKKRGRARARVADLPQVEPEGG